MQVCPPLCNCCCEWYYACGFLLHLHRNEIIVRAKILMKAARAQQSFSSHILKSCWWCALWRTLKKMKSWNREPMLNDNQKVQKVKTRSPEWCQDGERSCKIGRCRWLKRVSKLKMKHCHCFGYLLELWGEQWHKESATAITSFVYT